MHDAPACLTCYDTYRVEGGHGCPNCFAKLEKPYILPQSDDDSITANDCQQLLDAIKRGELDEMDLKNEINAQWRKGYRYGRRESAREHVETLKHLDMLREILEKMSND